MLRSSYSCIKGWFVLKSVIQPWVIYIIEAMCGSAGNCVKTLSSLKTFVFLFLYLHVWWTNKRPWGRYVIYMTWLDQQLPSQGCIVFRFLKTHYPVWMYSFPYFVGQYLLYHVAKTINSLGRSLRARIVRRRECVCQSPQDTPTPSETTTGTASELYAALASTSTSSYFTHQVV